MKNNLTIAEQIISFLFNLTFDHTLPHDIKVMHPFKDPEVKDVCQKFYHKFYDDKQPRQMIIGINPGRFGGGITGIPFTDPIRLQEDCGIENGWPKKQELSSVFIYEMIHAFGGAQAFYKQMYITAISPLGFTLHNKNLNYYDDKELMEDIKPFIISCMEKQLSFGLHTNRAFCLGEGKNYKYLQALNKEMKWFNEIIPLAHPRFIMQYRLKKKDDYIKHYLRQFQQ